MKRAFLTMALALAFMGGGCAAFNRACLSASDVFSFKKREYADRSWYPRRAGDFDIPPETP